MALFQPPPTVVLPTQGEGTDEAWDPIWIKWLNEFVSTLNVSVGGDGSSSTLSTAVFGRHETPGVVLLGHDEMQQILSGQIFGG